MGLLMGLDYSSSNDYTVITLRMIGKDRQDNYIVYQCTKCQGYTLIHVGRDQYRCKSCDGQITPATDSNRFRSWIEGRMLVANKAPGSKKSKIFKGT